MPSDYYLISNIFYSSRVTRTWLWKYIALYFSIHLNLISAKNKAHILSKWAKKHWRTRTKEQLNYHGYSISVWLWQSISSIIHLLNTCLAVFQNSFIENQEGRNSKCFLLRFLLRLQHGYNTVVEISSNN